METAYNDRSQPQADDIDKIWVFDDSNSAVDMNSEYNEEEESV